MKKFYSLLLSTLLLAVGGVEVEAQTLIKSWDFTEVNNGLDLTTVNNNDTTYKEISIDGIGVVVTGDADMKLAFKGKTAIVKPGGNGFLQISSKDNDTDMRNGVRIPAPQGYIVKVTGVAESTNEIFTWVGAEIDTNIGEEMFWSNTETTVAGIAISGELCSRIKNYVAVENHRFQTSDGKVISRALRIYKIEVYAPNSDFNFTLGDGVSVGEYQVYKTSDGIFRGYVMKGDNRTPLDVSLTGVGNNFDVNAEVTTPLLKSMFKEWNGTDRTANATKNIDCVLALNKTLNAGDIVYGNSDGTIPKHEYADISRADALRITGTPNLGLRLVFNRVIDNTDKGNNNTDNPSSSTEAAAEVKEYEEKPVEIGAGGSIDVSFDEYEYVHLNAIKIGWEQSGEVTGLTLVSKGINYTCDFKGDVTAEFDKSNGKISKIEGDGGAIVVRAVYVDPETRIENNAEYVITVPYNITEDDKTTVKEWSFWDTETKSNLYTNTSSLSDWGLTWKVNRHYGNDKYQPIEQLSGPVLSNSVPVSGDNARFIDTTAGLIFVADGYSFGTNVTVTPAYKENGGSDADKTERMHVRETYNSANNVQDDMNSAVSIKKGTTLIIPNLRAGQHIRFRWNRHTNDTGDKIKATNVLDLNRNKVDVFYTGSGSNKNSAQAHQEFIVEKNGDATFQLVENEGWINIFNIAIANEFIDTDLNIGTVEKEDIPKTDEGGNVVKDEKGNVVIDHTIYYDVPNKHNELSYNGHATLYTYLRKAGENPIKTKFTDVRGDIHMQSSLDPQYEIIEETYTGTLNADNCYIDKDVLHINSNAHGSFTLVQKGVTNDAGIGVTNEAGEIEPYMLDSLHLKVEVYEYDYNVKPYPYTWAIEHFTGDTGNNTISEIKTDKGLQGNEHFWKNINNIDNENNHIFNVGYPENLIAWKVKTPIVNGGEGKPKTVNHSLSAEVNAGTVQQIKDNNTDVATLTIGATGGNNFVYTQDNTLDGYSGYISGNGVGNDPKGTFYNIVPNYNGSMTIAVNVENGKELYIREYGIDEHNDVLIYRSGGLSDKDKASATHTYTFDVRKGRHYKVYSYESSLGLYGLSYTYYPNGGDEYYIPEFDGLGFFPMEYWNEKDNNVKLVPYANGIKLEDKDKTYCLIVPNVKRGETVYLAVTEDEDDSSVAVESPEATIKRAKNYSERVDYTSRIQNPGFESGTSSWEIDKENIENAKIKDNGVVRSITGSSSMEFWDSKTWTKPENETETDLKKYSFDIYQNINALPNGTYELRAKAFNAQVVEPTAKGHVELYAKVNGVLVSSTPVEVMVAKDDNATILSAREYSLSFTLNSGENIKDDDVVTIGFHTVYGDDDKMAARWFMCDDFELWYYGANGDERKGYVYLDNTTDYNKEGEYHNTPLNIYEINGYNNDMPIYLKNVTLHKVAVSVDNKNVSAAGYATEAREYPLDFTLARLFLGQEQKAFQVTGVNKDTKNPNVDISEVRYIPRTEDRDPAKNNGVMITGDYIPELKDRKPTTWPLFTTDVDRKMSDMRMTPETENKLIGVVAPSNLGKGIIDQKEGDYYNYLLALGGFEVTYEGEKDRPAASPETDYVTGVTDGLGFYLVLAKGTKLGENVQLSEAEKAEFGEDGYKGGLPQPHSAYLKLIQRLAQLNEFDEAGKTYPVNAAKVHQVFFIDVDSLLTDIDEVQADDEELPTTDNMANLLKDGVFYTLQGIPVKNPTKGIYIFNGKKVYVK